MNNTRDILNYADAINISAKIKVVVSENSLKVLQHIRNYLYFTLIFYLSTSLKATLQRARFRMFFETPIWEKIQLEVTL